MIIIIFLPIQETKSYHTAHATYKTSDDKLQQIQSDLEKARKKGRRIKEHERNFDKVEINFQKNIFPLL